MNKFKNWFFRQNNIVDKPLTNIIGKKEMNLKKHQNEEMDTNHRYKGAYFNENKIPSAQSEINQIIKLQ